jgi:hypothetical protein
MKLRNIVRVHEYYTASRLIRFYVLYDLRDRLYKNQGSVLRHTLKEDNVLQILWRESGLILFTYVWRY